MAGSFASYPILPITKRKMTDFGINNFAYWYV